MKGSVKANTVDKYLSPIRKQMIDLVDKGSTVTEYGCGNGDLLFQLSDKIKSGIGIDVSHSLITYANARKARENIQNLDFICGDLQRDHSLVSNTDVAIASLLFHVLPGKDASALLKQMINLAEITIVCGFVPPQVWHQSLLLWLDQRFSGHFHLFKAYQKAGYMQGLLDTVPGIAYEHHATFDPVIGIFKIHMSGKSS